jgi:hypothetical protein
VKYAQKYPLMKAGEEPEPYLFRVNNVPVKNCRICGTPTCWADLKSGSKGYICSEECRVTSGKEKSSEQT